MKNRIVEDVLYVFVCLNDPGVSPEYYICTAKEARAKTTQYATRGIVALSALRHHQYQNRWDKIDAALSS